MAQPPQFNYSIDVGSPFISALKGYELGMGIETKRQQMLGQQQLAQQQMLRQQEIDMALEKIRGPNPTAEDYRRLEILLPPDQAKSIRESLAQRTDVQNQQALRSSGRIFAAFRAGRPDIAINFIDQEIETQRNAGNEAGAKSLETWRDVAKNSEEGVKQTQDFFGFVISEIPGGDKIIESALKISKEAREGEPKEGFRPITAQERERFGLPPNVSFQVGPDGKIMPITKEPLVTISGPLVGAENKYAETVGTETAREDVEAVKAANKGVGDLSKINRTLNQLYTSKAITGIGADMLNTVEKLKARLGSDVAAGKVADTELLDALLGADVFPQIGALGIGARGLDTPAEREFLRSVMTGTISMNKETLIRMTEIRRDIQEEAIKQYNEKLERGELDRYFEITRRQKRPLPLTEEQERRIERRRAGIIDARPQPGRRQGVAPFTPSPVPSAIEQAVDRSLRSRADAIIRGQ
jgi:hypothetical protein